ncbi:PHP domain-containing protein [Candidatus Daviesbacteria bacterium]|nr:PHP domain-containing protein [Candidatus Daviesbacteria bacterium]
MREIIGKVLPNIKFADLHMHTSRSDGRMDPKSVIDLAARNLNLNVLAITDHEVTGPAIYAKNYCRRMGYDLEVIVGSEITTSEGHLVGLYLKNDIPSGKNLEWTIKEIHKQDGLAVAPHPMYRLTRSITKQDILRATNSQDSMVYFDGFEIFNAGILDNIFIGANKSAQKFYRDFPKQLGAAIGSSDGHFFSVGRGLTGFSGDLKDAITRNETAVLSSESPEKIEILELIKQMFGSMVLEPKRRIERYTIRQFSKGELGV